RQPGDGGPRVDARRPRRGHRGGCPRRGRDEPVDLRRAGDRRPRTGREGPHRVSVLFEVDERGVARLTLNRPEVRNAFDDALIAAVTATLDDLPESVRVLVLAGAGPAFCAGADLNWMRSMASYSREDNIADSSRLRRMFETLDACPVPVV